MSLSLRKLEAAGAKKTKTRHYIRAFENRGRLPSGRAWKRTQARILDLYRGIYKRYGGDAIRPDVKALIDGARDARIIRELGMLYVTRAGVMRGDSLMKGNLEMHSVICAQLVAYSNLERLNLEAAARLAAQKPLEDPVLMIEELTREVDAEEAEAQAAREREAAAKVRDERSPGGEGQGQDKDQAGDEG
jgi:hypothetical protein